MANIAHVAAGIVMKIVKNRRCEYLLPQTNDDANKELISNVTRRRNKILFMRHRVKNRKMSFFLAELEVDDDNATSHRSCCFVMWCQLLYLRYIYIQM